MIDLRLNKYLVEKQMNIAEYYFLYNIMVSQRKIAASSTIGGNREDVLIESSKYFVQYLKQNKTYLNTSVSMIDVLQDLEKRGFVKIWTKNREEIDVTKIEITDKFSGDFYTNNIDKVFKEFRKIYPAKGTTSTGTIWFTMDKPYDEMLSLFTKLTKNGELITIQRLFMVTEQYIADSNSNFAQYKMSKYFELFENIAQTYENGDNNVGGTGRRQF